MKLLVMSDLHLEFSTLRVDPGDADVIILAGDIAVGDAAFPWIRAQFGDRPVLYVAGNHEYYKHEYHSMLAQLREAARQSGVYFLERDAMVIGDVHFYGTTLWTDMALFGHDQEGRPAGVFDANTGLNDFSLISFEENGKRRLFSAEDSVALHHESRSWLQDSLARCPGKSCVITHHAPSALSVPERFAQSPLTPAFASAMDGLVAKANVWIHGHTHDSFDYRIGQCQVACNPRGYTRPWKSLPENTEFDPCKIITI